ncbi:3-hydroxydecanoyl-ACP dehydratase [Oceanobacter sp. RED65]|uniref:3-hydroxydecanoyl-ACP dehydratase n=2 Tax=Bermanella marisrubri TaxID=207949 RepID=Q1N689_9GAMM|nr:3-hydroxydecanoyl-ACP dehydratase [Oceanobacter sp. RED65] [Bermanella marisrubri]
MKEGEDMNAVKDVINQDVESILDAMHGAQLPQGELKLLNHVPLISEQGGRYGKGQVIAQMKIHPDLWFFKCHFPGDPIMPGCLGIEGLWQSLGLFLAFKGAKGKGRALGVGELKFLGEVLPSNQLLQFQVHIKKIKSAACTLVVADGDVLVDGKLIYQAKDIKVGMF